MAAAHPATGVQLVHACRLWGFSAVVPSSWGDELIASHVIQRCASRVNGPVIQCSCPRVSERLARHAAVLDDAIFWLVSPPVAVAKYLRGIESDREIQVTYAGGCPGASDPSIDESITPDELLAAIRGKGIDVAAQPTVFDDVIPADRRRHASSAGGLPDQHRLWDAASFRVSQPTGGDLVVSVAQLLLAEERLLIDLSPMVGCVCRTTDERLSHDAMSLQRSPSPVVTAGQVDLSRPAPPMPISALAELPPVGQLAPRRPRVDEPSALHQGRLSQGRPAYRRQSTWRRQSPRPGVVVARTSAVLMAVNDNLPFVRQPRVRLLVAALLVAAALIVAFWIGRRTSPAKRTAGDYGAWLSVCSSAARSRVSRFGAPGMAASSATS